MNVRLLLVALGGALLLPALAPPRAIAQVSGGTPDPAPAELARRGQDALGAARAAQRRFEIARVRWLAPTGWSSGGCDGRIDERIGRMCLSHGEGDWRPTPDAPGLVDARDALLRELADAHALAPTDPWILGQRVLYLGEAGRWEAADSLAGAACAVRPDVWCRALEGLALHALGRFPDSERAFRAALDAMEPDSARAWLDPELLLDARGRSWLRSVAPAEKPRAVDRVWMLADPLLLAPGNDRLTEHLSRLTYARARAAARNPYGMVWSGDLEEMLVRYGWEVGWERVDERSVDLARPDAVVGHHDPESRPLMPTGVVLAHPEVAPASAWVPEFQRPRATYAPGYAAAVLPADAQLAVFPRGDRFVLVGAIALPDDTTRRAREAPEGRNEPRPPWRGAAAEAGLFLVPMNGQPTGVRSAGSSGAMLLEAAPGAWVASLESWDPSARRAGRLRAGLRLVAREPDLPTLSDLLLIEGSVSEALSLEEAAARALPRAWVRPGERLAIVWELYGLSSTRDALSYRLTVERRRPGLLRRAASALGLLRPARGRLLEWSEDGPGRPGPALRGVELDLSELDPGSWVIRLEVHPRGRTPLIEEREIELRRPPEG